MKTRTPIIFSLVLTLLAPTVALADNGHGGGSGQPPYPPGQQPPARGHGDQGHHNNGHQDYGRHDNGRRGAPRTVVIEEHHHRDADVWFRAHPSWYRPVPVEIEREVIVNRYLPRGYYHRPPVVIVDMLPPPPPGYAYFTVGERVVLAAIATGLIAQIIFGGP